MNENKNIKQRSGKQLRGYFIRVWEGKAGTHSIIMTTKMTNELSAYTKEAIKYL